MSETETAFRFLLQNDAQPFWPSTCFIVADPKVMDRKIWSLELDRPKDAEWFFQIDDIKDWMLHGTEPVRKMYYDRHDPRTPFRELDRDEVFREYLRKILDKLPVEYRHRRKYALMPSIGDDRTRTRYRNAVEAALPDVTIIPEPEMVAEYFRLLKRTLELESGVNNVILVVDVGASTANMTLVVSRRDQAIVGAATKKGAQRDQRLRALRGDSVDNAGRWVDKQLAQALGVPEARTDKDLESRDHVLRAIERAKVSASQTGKRADISRILRPGVLDRFIDIYLFIGCFFTFKFRVSKIASSSDNYYCQNGNNDLLRFCHSLLNLVIYLSFPRKRESSLKNSGSRFKPGMTLACHF